MIPRMCGRSPREVKPLGEKLRTLFIFVFGGMLFTPGFLLTISLPEPLVGLPLCVAAGMVFLAGAAAVRATYLGVDTTDTAD